MRKHRTKDPIRLWIDPARALFSVIDSMIVPQRPSQYTVCRRAVVFAGEIGDLDPHRVNKRLDKRLERQNRAVRVGVNVFPTFFLGCGCYGISEYLMN